MSFSARALIRLDALKHNFDLIRSRAAGASIMAVVKANAYGHGLTAVAGALPEVDSLAVARLPEAQQLRAAGIRKPVVLLSGVYSDEELSEACAVGCELVVHVEEQLQLLEARSDLQATVWLKIDTGMHRLGFYPAQMSAVASRLRRCKSVRELRLMSHLGNADDRSDPQTVRQAREFESIISQFDGTISIANSGGLLGWPEDVVSRFAAHGSAAWVRPGIALYGVSPFPESNAADLGLRPVMQFESRLIAVKPLQVGQRVGYGGVWTASENTVLGIVSAGYGDGYSRSLPSGTPVRVNNRTVPLVGRVSMDSIAVDLGKAASDRVGDPVLLWGDALPVEEVARNGGVLAYSLICGVMHRESSLILA